jgi:hypothetical protein
MDLKQNKLTRSEWDSIEIPVSPEEKEILRLIMSGYQDINIKINKTVSMLAFLKIDYTPEIETFLYNKYFTPIIQKFMNKYGKDMGILPPSITQQQALKKIRSIDQMRLDNLDANIQQNTAAIYEYVLLELCQNMCKYISKKSNKYALYLYTIIQLRKTSIHNINKHVADFVQTAVDYANQRTNLRDIIERAYDFIERNKTLLEYADKELFAHQKELFSIFNQATMQPKLVLYIAPTGTGKTMSPIGLAAGYRIIFVCVARHIGLALAKAAISMEKKIAFAFGCETASDIRLHYFSAAKFTKHNKSGAIHKVDNSEGQLVEIMICDVKSYLTAMHYMLAFNSATQLITYWDEPTITMDYETHELHDTIHRNWVNNLIPNVVFSCATLPHEDELVPVWMDFRAKFEDAEIHQVTSYDCRKSIPMMTKDGYCAMPHTMYDSHISLRQCVQQCELNKTLLRYFDLSEIVVFVFYIQDYISEDLQIDAYFKKIDDITMNSLKIYYLELLKRLPEEHWPAIYAHFAQKKSQFQKLAPKIVKSASEPTQKDAKEGKPITRTTSMQSMHSKNKLVDSNGLQVTTEDAYTLTDGPTIFLCDDVAKIGNFYIQQTKIPTELFQIILKKIDTNNKLSEKIAKLELEIEDMENKVSNAGDKDSTKDLEKNPEIFGLYQDIDALRRQVKYIAMDPEYVPNTRQHQKKWAPQPNKEEDECHLDAYVPTIDETTTRNIMGLDIDNYLKVMLLLGIGLFMEGVNPRYLEMMKTLAVEQNLFMIIASSDYVYGTNYNFCHGFLGKDLQNMTREKTLQCMGRIGRGQIQQKYTIRFRDDDMIYGLFRVPDVNREAINMCNLFTSD